MGGILHVAGVPGFLENRAELYDRLDPEREKWCQFLRVWHQAHGEKPVGVADVIDLGVQSDIVADTERGARNVLGCQIRAKVDRVFAGYRLTHAGTRDRAARYQVRNVSPVTVRDESTESTETDAPVRVCVSDAYALQETHIEEGGSDTADSFDSSAEEGEEREEDENWETY